MKFNVRRAEVSDTAAILAVHMDAFGRDAGGNPSKFPATGDWAPSITAQLTRHLAEGILDRDELWLVVECGARIFGYATGGKGRGLRARTDGELYLIHLLSEGRGQGAGTALVGELVKGFTDPDGWWGFKRIAVRVVEGELWESAAGFYKKLGAVELSRERDQLRGVDHVIITLGWHVR